MMTPQAGPPRRFNRYPTAPARGVNQLSGQCSRLQMSKGANLGQDDVGLGHLCCEMDGTLTDPPSALRTDTTCLIAHLALPRGTL